MVRVIAFTGLPGAGKSEAVAVARERGLPVVRMGDHVWAEAKRRGLPLEDRHVGSVASEMRKTQGMDYWARVTCDAIERDHAGAALIVVDGVRNVEEVESFRQRLGDRFELVAVLAPTELRQDRLLQRKRSDDTGTREELRQRDEREIGWGVTRSIALADHRIVNAGDVAEFRKAIEALLDRLTASA